MKLWQFRFYWSIFRNSLMKLWQFRFYWCVFRNCLMKLWQFRFYWSITRFLSNYQFVIMRILFVHCATVPMTFACITVFTVEQERFSFMNTSFRRNNIICVNMLVELFRVGFICSPECYWRKQKLVTWRFIRYFMLD